MEAGQNREALMVEERESQPILSITWTVDLARLTEAQSDSLRELWSLTQRRGVKPAGPPFIR
jgi:hypothetical protein